MHRIQLNSTNEVGTFVFAAAMSRPDEGYDQSKTTVIVKIFEAMNLRVSTKFLTNIKKSGSFQGGESKSSKKDF